MREPGPASASPELSVRRARELLGVAAQADAAQVALAYRRQARRLHPDISVEPDATEQFRTLQAAYQVALAAAQRGVPQVRTPAAHHRSTVVLGAPVRSGILATAWRERGGVAWLAAGPVHVRPPQRPNLGTTATSTEHGQ